MKTNSFNICPTCTHRETCVLTNQKSQVWSCSEYDEGAVEHSNIKKEHHPEMVMS
jgi:hypothetical protein